MTDNPTVSRVARSVDDLRVGQVVTFHHLLMVPRWELHTIDALGTGADPENVRFRNQHGDPFVVRFSEASQWVILSDPPPAPLVLSAEAQAALDRLREAVHKLSAAGMDYIQIDGGNLRIANPKSVRDGHENLWDAARTFLAAVDEGAN